MPGLIWESLGPPPDQTYFGLQGEPGSVFPPATQGITSLFLGACGFGRVVTCAWLGMQHSKPIHFSPDSCNLPPFSGSGQVWGFNPL